MSTIKTDEEIETLTKAGRRLADVLGTVVDATKAGVTSQELEDIARSKISEYGDEPAFLGYQPAGADEPFPAALCVSVNNEIVHGIPNQDEKELAGGDIVTVDSGLIHDGLVVDSAYTVGVGEIGSENKELIKTAKQALYAGIDAARAGNRVGDISASIEERVADAGYAIYKQLIGHGVGYEVHEPPNIPNVGEPGTGPKLKKGMVLAIEPMIGRGKPAIEIADDGYTYRTKDGSVSAHFEHTIAITEGAPKIITDWKFDKI